MHVTSHNMTTLSINSRMRWVSNTSWRQSRAALNLTRKGSMSKLKCYRRIELSWIPSCASQKNSPANIPSFHYYSSWERTRRETLSIPSPPPKSLAHLGAEVLPLVYSILISWVMCTCLVFKCTGFETLFWCNFTQRLLLKKKSWFILKYWFVCQLKF